MASHGLTTLLLLALNNIPCLDGSRVIYLFTDRRASWVLPSFGHYEWSRDACHVRVQLSVWTCFQLLWVNAERAMLGQAGRVGLVSYRAAVLSGHELLLRPRQRPPTVPGSPGFSQVWCGARRHFNVHLPVTCNEASFRVLNCHLYLFSGEESFKAFEQFYKYIVS